MGDLISRKAVIELLKNNVSNDIEEVVVTDKNIKLIESMPCSYNVDAVVAGIEEFYEEAEHYGFASALSDIVEVVKWGGI